MAGSPGPTKHSPDFSYSRWEFPARGCLSSQSALRKQFANDELFGAPAKTRGWNTVSTADFEGLRRSRPCDSCRMSGNPEVVREGRPVSGLPTIHEVTALCVLSRCHANHPFKALHLLCFH